MRVRVPRGAVTVVGLIIAVGVAESIGGNLGAAPVPGSNGHVGRTVAPWACREDDVWQGGHLEKLGCLIPEVHRLHSAKMFSEDEDEVSPTARALVGGDSGNDRARAGLVGKPVRSYSGTDAVRRSHRDVHRSFACRRGGSDACVGNDSEFSSGGAELNFRRSTEV